MSVVPHRLADVLPVLEPEYLRPWAAQCLAGGAEGLAGGLDAGALGGEGVVGKDGRGHVRAEAAVSRALRQAARV